MLRIIEPGIMNTIQDAGRWGYQAYGVPVSGAMDGFSLRVANRLVRNVDDEAAIEIHSTLACETDRAHLVALTGAEAIITIDGRAMPMWTSLFVRAHSRIEIQPREWGWCYLGIHGGIAVPRVMGSKSTYLRGGLGGLDGRAVQAGDEIEIGVQSLNDLVAAAGCQSNEQVRAWLKRTPVIRVRLGPHRDYFSDDAIDRLLNTEYVVTESADRMGYRLRGPAIAKKRADELVSCGVPLGAIQVPPDGQPIVLMADHQTTGGYPIIATVITEDIALLAQMGPGKRIAFQAVN
jgi:antagonist of KipI